MSAAGSARSAAADAPLHARSFKLRFATQHELGRSDVSAVKPLGLPAVVRGKWFAHEAGGAQREVSEQRVQSALQRVRALFRGPRERHAEPLTSAHEYGWWAHSAAAGDARLQHRIRDSQWLKERLRVLADRPAERVQQR